MVRERKVSAMCHRPGSKQGHILHTPKRTVNIVHFPPKFTSSQALTVVAIPMGAPFAWRDSSKGKAKTDSMAPKASSTGTRRVKRYIPKFQEQLVRFSTRYRRVF